MVLSGFFSPFVTNCILMHLITEIIRKEGLQVSDFSGIYEEDARKIYRFLLSLSGDECMAEELTQQTFYKAFIHIKKFEGRCSLYTWLCQIAKNEWLMECRKKKTFPINEQYKAEDAANPEIQVIQRVRQKQIHDAIRRLPALYRDVLILRTYGELSFAEIASNMGKTESWAKVTYFRGKDKLKKELEGFI